MAAHEAGGRRGWLIWRKKWSIISVVGVLVFSFFRYGGVAPPPQDNDFIKVVGTEVCPPPPLGQSHSNGSLRLSTPDARQQLRAHGLPSCCPTKTSSNPSVRPPRGWWSTSSVR